MRNILEVLDKVVAVIPVSEKAVRQRLASVKNTAMYTPPECIVGVWRMAAAVLTSELPWPPKEEWQKDVHAIFSDQPRVKDESANPG